MSRQGLLPALITVAACATTTPPAPTAATPVADPAQVVAEFEQQIAAADADDPLNHPASVDDVLEILKRDQMDLFPAGVAFAAQSTDPKAKVLQSQIELAWGEAQLVLSNLFVKIAADRRIGASRLDAREATGVFTETQKQRLADLHASIRRESALADALARTAAGHIARGAEEAKDIVAAAPSDYTGYRLMGDYYRMRGDWADFDAMVAKVDATNPGSNGLMFLRAMSQIEREGRVADGQELLRLTLATDPKFVRAQAELVLTAQTPEERYAALLDLEKRNPRHQIVTWLGPGIKEDHAKEQRQRQKEDQK
jgi:hypothetical protein